MVRATAWCRADFAGGTLDIWPLGLLHPGACTVNVALELPVEVRLERRADGYVVEPGDGRVETRSLAELQEHPATALAGVVAGWLDLPPCTIAITSGSPRGAGLGASSALTVALLAAGERLLDRADPTVEARAAVARDLEARLMKLPTGQQDHFPALLGGALEIEHAPGGERVTRLELDLEALAERLVVAYTGQSHFSAGANWRVIRGRLESDPALTARLDTIRDVACEMSDALRAADWERAGHLMHREWRARRGLAEGISTPQIERLLDEAMTLGAWGGKACGAGGGGSIAVLCPPERRAALVAAWRHAGAMPLEAARPTRRGLELDPS